MKKRTGFCTSPTVLDFFGIEPTGDMQGRSLRDTLASDTPVREAGLFGIFGGQVNVTDGRYVYMRAPATADNQPLYNYTLLPTHMREMFGVSEFEGVELAPPFSFTKDCRTLRTKGRAWNNPHTFKTVLYDLQTDPAQEQPIQDEEIEANMIELLIKLLRDSDAPTEQYERLGLCDRL